MAILVPVKNQSAESRITVLDKYFVYQDTDMILYN